MGGKEKGKKGKGKGGKGKSGGGATGAQNFIGGVGQRSAGAH